MDELARIAAALERIAVIAEAWVEPRMVVADPDYMCPNCVTPWKCNGPHIHLTGDLADPPEPDWRMPESPDDVPHTTPRVYRLSGERHDDLADGDHHFFPAGVGR